MRTRITLDDELLAKAQRYSGIVERSALIREALTALVEREAALWAIKLGGTEPELKPAPRRRPR